MTDFTPHPEADEPAPDEGIPPAGTARLGAALDALYGSGAGDLGVPPGRDAAVRDEIRRSFGREPLERRARGRNPWRIAAPVATAAGIVLAIGVWRFAPRTGPAPETNGPPLAVPAGALADSADLDGNGTVDILDAFGLARRLDAGAVDDVVFDLNGDGIVDARDVEAIAMRAVALDGGAG